MKKIIMFCLLILTALFLPSFSSTAEEAVPSLFDGANLLNTDQAENLRARIAVMENKHHVRIAVVTQKTLDGQRIGDAADRLADMYYSDGENGNIVLLIDMGSREYYVSTDREMRKKITDETGMDEIRKAFTEELSSGNYEEAFNAYVSVTDRLLTYYEKEGKPYDPADAFSPMALLAGGVLAFLAALGIRGRLIDTMSNVKPVVSVSEFLEKDSFHLTSESDRYLYTNRIVTPIPEQSQQSSQGSSGGHGGGGGRF
mgnify:CR=1 FL=1